MSHVFGSLGMVLGLMFTSVSLAAEPLQGVFMVVKGDVKISHSTAPGEAAKVGGKVTAGDTIVAGPDSRAKIVMSDKNVFNISPDSKFVIEKYTNSKDDKNVEVKVEFGKVRSTVEERYDGEKSKFNVKTPSAVAGVRGTDFVTSYSAATKESSVITFRGTVAVGLPGPNGTISNPVYVKQGMSTTTANGAGPSAPKAMPPAELEKANSNTSAESNQKSDAGSKSADGKKPAGSSGNNSSNGSAANGSSNSSASSNSSGSSGNGNSSNSSNSNTANSNSTGTGGAAGSSTTNAGSANTSDSGRSPASAGGPSMTAGSSMISNQDLGTGPTATTGSTTAPPPANAPVFVAPPVPVAPPAIPNNLINSVIQKSTTNTTIIIH